MELLSSQEFIIPRPASALPPSEVNTFAARTWKESEVFAEAVFTVGGGFDFATVASESSSTFNAEVETFPLKGCFDLAFIESVSASVFGSLFSSSFVVSLNGSAARFARPSCFAGLRGVGGLHSRCSAEEVC
jgi:hypothetical protein